ncbi:metalloprotease family protein [Planococcus versutus]|uniref:metalloprotease family protein n=1 Tax=Planococcus versutus TaxID=1302659 RepID=UPI000A43E13F
MSPTRIIELKMDTLAPKILWFHVVLIVLFAITYHFFNSPWSFHFSLSATFLFVVGYFILIVVHELFHLIGFVLFGKVPISSLNYGINLKLGIAYATTGQPLQNHTMRKVLLLPF